MVQSSHSASPLAVKMSVPQNSLFSVFLRKYKLLAPLPDETETRGCYSGNPVEGHCSSIIFIFVLILMIVLIELTQQEDVIVVIF